MNPINTKIIEAMTDQELTQAKDMIHNELNKRLPNELPILTCSNCGFTTRSVFAFTEHYENDVTGNCDEVHY